MDSIYGKIGDAGRESFAELAAQIITNGENLQDVNFGRSNFSATATTSILSAMSASPSAQKVQKFFMTESANMAEEETCQALADFLAIAENLSTFSLRGHKGR